ncbi:hypothetical protein SHIRM173S_05747 [Streptomyces hirsutus]
MHRGAQWIPVRETRDRARENRQTEVHRQSGAHRQAEAAERLDAFADLFDPTTFRHLEAVGVGAGWRCWEIGADGVSVVSWLAKKVRTDRQSTGHGHRHHPARPGRPSAGGGVRP